VLVVGQNFGCGSSREHAPQALMRWGIRAIVGGSYGEIFFGNCTANGIPCVVAEPADVAWLLREVEKHPREALELDVERQEVRFLGRAVRARIPDGAQARLVTGSWNEMSVLLDAGEAIERTAQALPYVSGF
jgi:3-isopropylmalate/(R)-2-methylmalate dehydratase small subunit